MNNRYSMLSMTDVVLCKLLELLPQIREGIRERRSIKEKETRKKKKTNISPILKRHSASRQRQPLQGVFQAYEDKVTCTLSHNRGYTDSWEEDETTEDIIEVVKSVIVSSPGDTSVSTMGSLLGILP